MGSSVKLVFSPLARDDLRATFQYGCLHWGRLRSQRYMEHIKEQIQYLTKHPELGVSREEIMEGVRSLSIDSHVIFYRCKSNQIEIIRLLHGRQDPQRHL